MTHSALLGLLLLPGFVLACGSDEADSPTDSRAGSGGGGSSGAAAGAPSAGAAQGGAAQAGAAQGGTAQAGAAQGGAAQAGSAQGGAGAGSSGSAGSAPVTALDPNLPPGKNFDLKRFTLQLPVADGDSVKQITDLGSYTSEFFYTAPDGAMTFWCPVTGAHTPSTKYPRSELREVPVGGDWAISGSHRLSASFKVTKNVASKGTIIGQIHGNATGGTSEVLKLEWTSNNTIVASLEDNDAPATQIDKTLGSYTLGDLVSYVIELKESVLTVTVTDSKGSKSVTSPYTAASWTKDKYYFKLGNYVQLATGANTDGARVSFYSLDVQHGQ